MAQPSRGGHSRFRMGETSWGTLVQNSGEELRGSWIIPTSEAGWEEGRKMSWQVEWEN